MNRLTRLVSSVLGHCPHLTVTLLAQLVWLLIGGPVGPDVYFTNPNLLTHVIRTPPDPDVQDATTGPVGPYVGGGPVGPDPYLLMQVMRTSPDPDGQDDTTGPAGLYIGGGPVDQTHSFFFLRNHAST